MTCFCQRLLLCAFGGPDLKTLYVTAGKTLFRIKMDIPRHKAMKAALGERQTVHRSLDGSANMLIPWESCEIGFVSQFFVER